MNGVEKYADQLRANEGIKFAGLTFYPLTVRDYSLYRRAATAIELMQASLPPKLARLSWAHCLDEMDNMAKSGVFLPAVLMVMAKALRLKPLIGKKGEKDYPIYTLRKKDTQTFQAVAIKKDDELFALSVQQMDEVRRILAAQNDYQIPDENWNPDLVAARQYLAQSQEPQLELSIDAWVYSVSVNARVSSEDVWDWPIRKFKGYSDAIDRTLGYQIYTLAQAAGFTKFENGNPFPTWKFEKISELPFGFKELGRLEAKAKGVLPEPAQQ